jgi:photosystem II stability/assembly factor-like uncharacterized protein
MTRSLRLFLFLIMLLCENGWLSAQPAWNLVAPFPPRLGAYSAIVSGSRAYFWTWNNLVYATSDGGTTFTVAQYAPLGDVGLGGPINQGLGFTDSLTGIVSDAVYGQYKTKDGGKSWMKVFDRQNDGGNILVFGTNGTGWRFTPYGVYKTTNGGDAWQYHGIPGWKNGGPGKAFALDDQRVWLTRMNGAGDTTDGAIWSSADGGTSWEKLMNAPVSDDSTEVRYWDLQFLADGTGLAVGSKTKHLQYTEAAFVSRTSDFGKTWQTSDMSGGRPTSALSAGNRTWLIFTEEGDTAFYRRSTDNGVSWTKLQMPSLTPGHYSFCAAVCIENLNCILAVFIDGIYRSFDRGASFSRLTSARDIVITDAAVERNHAGPGHPGIIAYGVGLSLLLSEDDGLTWQKKTISSAPKSASTISRARMAGGVIYAMVDQLTMFKSLDKGNTWSRLSTPNLGGQQGLEVYDANTAAVNGYPYMLSTNDGGTTWAHPLFPTSCWVREIFMSDAGTFYAAGSYSDTGGTKGMFYRTNDAGYNFRIVDVPKEILRFRRIGTSAIFALGAYALYRSMDDGKSWTTVRSSDVFSISYTSFAFRDSLFGIVKEGYAFIQTHDGGTTWTPSTFSVPFRMGPDALERTSDGRLFAAGEGSLYIQSEPMTDWKISGTSAFIGHEHEKSGLSNAYPNPFNPSTNISFNLPAVSRIRLTVYDVLGREVEVLADGVYSAGRHEAVFNAGGRPSGIFFYRLQAGASTETKRLLLLR